MTVRSFRRRPGLFHGGIAIPTFHLWDAVLCRGGHAPPLLPRRQSNRPDGTPLPPAERNNVPFHIRHFVSTDRGASRRDEGCLLGPGAERGLADWTVWAESIEPCPTARLAGLHRPLRPRPEHCFVQGLMLACRTDTAVESRDDEALICPIPRTGRPSPTPATIWPPSATSATAGARAGADHGLARPSCSSTGTTRSTSSGHKLRTEAGRARAGLHPARTGASGWRSPHPPVTIPDGVT